MKKNYKFRLYPSKKQARELLATLEECRLVYNKILETRIKAYKNEKKTLNKYDANNLIKEWKKEKESLKNIHSQVLQNVSERVDLAFKAFFRRCKEKGEKPGFPRFKQFGRYDSFTYPQSGFSLTQNSKRLKLSKIGFVKIRLHRALPEQIKRLTIQRTSSGKWYAVFSCVIENVEKTNANPAVGIDLGLKEFAVLSDGKKIKRERFIKEGEKKLAKAQQKLSQLEKTSPKRNKQKVIVSRIHEKIQNQRSDFTHKLSRKLANQYGIICLEKLNIKSMQKQKTISVNGKKIKATKIHKSIQDVAWNQFVQQLDYKAEEAGSRIVYVNPKNTTKMCSSCGKITGKELSDRTHKCGLCGLIMDRDLNASKNVLRIGMDSLGNSDISIKVPIRSG